MHYQLRHSCLPCNAVDVFRFLPPFVPFSYETAVDEEEPFEMKFVFIFSGTFDGLSMD